MGKSHHAAVFVTIAMITTATVLPQPISLPVPVPLPQASDVPVIPLPGALQNSFSNNSSSLMMQKMVSLPSEEPQGVLFLAAALPSLCIREGHAKTSSAAPNRLFTQRSQSPAAYFQMSLSEGCSLALWSRYNQISNVVLYGEAVALKHRCSQQHPLFFAIWHQGLLPSTVNSL